MARYLFTERQKNKVLRNDSLTSEFVFMKEVFKH